MKSFYKYNLGTFLLAAFSFLSLAPASAQVSTLKMELFNQQVWIKVALQNSNADSLQFVFDSGAAASLLDSAIVARVFPDKHLDRINAMGVGGNAAMKQLNGQSLYLNGLKLDNVNFVVSDLSRLSGRMGRKLDGIIGYDLLKQYVTQIDIDHKSLRIYKDINDITTEKGKPLDFDFSPQFANFPRMKGSFTTQAGQSYSGYFIFDSGAAVTAMLNTPFVNEHQLLTKSGKTTSTKAEGLTNSSDKYTARINSFTFNGETFNDLPISMSQTTAGVSAAKGYVGLIGNQLLFRYNIIFDYKHSAIYLQPNAAHNAPFEFPLHSFTLKTSNGNIYLDNIAPGSPEKEQGLEENAQLISVNGKKDMSITEVRKLLQHEGKITLKVKQTGGEKEFVIPLYPRI